MISSHPAAELFPMLGPDELHELAQDIKENGLLTPIILADGLVLDGRNRLAACEMAGIAPRFEEYTGCTPTQYVISQNIRRRHLTASQKAAIAAEALPLFEAEARARQATSTGGASPQLKEILPEAAGQARDQAGAAVGVSGRYVSEAKEIREKAPEAFERVKAGELSIPAAKKEMSVHYSSESVEHYTPKWVLDSVLCVMGEIDLDPCSNSGTDPNVPAMEHYTKDSDGLSKEWRGRVFMNPPYGDEIGQWTRKLADEVASGRVTEAIALLPARTDTAWWYNLITDRRYWCVVHLLKGRLKFGDAESGAPFPSALVYFGDRRVEFVEELRADGVSYQPLHDLEMTRFVLGDPQQNAA